MGGAHIIATEVLSQSTVRFALLGMATGSLVALVALGVVLAYRASGVLNFAAGAQGALGAFVCYVLRDDHAVAPWLALLAGLATGAASGMVMHGIMTVLRRTSLLTRLIATLSTMSAIYGLIVVLWDEDKGQPDSYLPTRNVTLVGDLRIGQDRLILIGLVAMFAIALRLVYSKTLFGLATSAVAENRRVAASAGWSTSTIEMVNFTLAGVLSATAAIFLAPIITLHVAVLTNMVLVALAAALVGRFSSFGLTVAGAFAIGILQSELALFQPDLAERFDVGPQSLTGLPQAVPMLIIVAVTVFGGRARLARGEAIARLPLPGTGRVPVPAVVGGLVVAGTALVAVPGWADALVATFGMGILVLSVVVVTGYAGQLSLCQFALGGFGAWVAARLVATQGLRFELALLVGVATTVLAGLVVALPALRTRGVNLAVATLALALLFNSVIFTNSSLTGGLNGTVVDEPSVFGIGLDPLGDPQRYGAFVLVLFVLTALVVANVRRGRSGRRLLAVRSNERAAAALGVGVYGAKLYAFGLGAGIAAVGGIVLAFRQTNVQFTTFNVLGSISLVQYAVIGGLGWVAGAGLGALAAPGALGTKVLNDLLGGIDDILAWSAIIAGAGATLQLAFAPDGSAARLAGAMRERFRGVDDRVRRLVERPPTTATSDGPHVQPPATVEVRGITVRFGGVTALDDVHLRVDPGEIVGLIGPNGAGKTTLLDVITGFTPPERGQVLLDGGQVDRRSPEQRARAGMIRSWQAVELFEEMTIRDNLLVAADRQSPWRYFTDLVRPGRQPTTTAIEAVLADLGLTDVIDRRPSALSQGATRLVGIARAIAAEPTVLFLDEPAAGLDHSESRELARSVRRIAAGRGLGVLVVEHDVPLLLDLCDRLVVLDFGRVIAAGTPDAVRVDPAVVAAYLGEPVTAASPGPSDAPEPADPAAVT
ncbi:MAG TPA: branched-chain amino acid ABC transporter permease/ATP-binding protein [Acidimicrobiales bacterium]|nr:branched-chain amino acid ABC transporter permease/ATP-binding protein [Acidimicrobiales bacterium]